MRKGLETKLNPLPWKMKKKMVQIKVPGNIFLIWKIYGLKELSFNSFQLLDFMILNGWNRILTSITSQASRTNSTKISLMLPLISNRKFKSFSRYLCTKETYRKSTEYSQLENWKCVSHPDVRAIPGPTIFKGRISKSPSSIHKFKSILY